MKYLKRSILVGALALISSHTAHADELKLGQIKNENAVIVTNKTMMAKKVAGDYANYTLYVNDKTQINGIDYYRVQTSEDINHAIGFIKADDLNIFPITKKKSSTTLSLNSSTKVYDVPYGTERQIVDRANKGVQVTVDESVIVDQHTYVHGTFSNGMTGWVEMSDTKTSNPKEQLSPKKTQVHNTSQQKSEDKDNTTETSASLVQGTGITHTTVPFTLKEALQKQMKMSPQSSNGVKWKDAHSSSVLQYMSPERLITDPIGKYQFLVLNHPQGLTVDQLNSLLVGKGILEGQGAAFKTASEKYHVNEIYLISHAFLETAEGESKLATGMTVKGEDKDKHFYNMYGVGAYDKNPLKYGSQYAANVGWDTPAKAIIGGAQFISSGFVNESQNTLYTMRWNPMSPGDTQYATDIQWAAANANYIAGFYNRLGIDGGRFNFIHYSK